MKKIDKKSKPEQLFVLMLLAVVCLGVLRSQVVVEVSPVKQSNATA